MPHVPGHTDPNEPAWAYDLRVAGNGGGEELTTLVGETIIDGGQAYKVTGQQAAQLGAADAGFGTAIPGSPVAAEQQGKPAGFIIQDSTGQQFLLPAGNYVTTSGKSVWVDDSGNLVGQGDATAAEVKRSREPTAATEPSDPGPGSYQTIEVGGANFTGWYDDQGVWHNVRTAAAPTGGNGRAPGGSSREIAPGVLGIFDGDGNIIGYTGDPAFEADFDRQARQATMLQQLQAALRNAVLNQDLNFTQALDIWKEEQGKLEKAADVSTARGPTKLKALQGSIPGGFSLNLPGLGPDGGIGPAPVHQFESQEDLFSTLFPGPTPDEIAAGPGTPLPTPPEQPTTEDLIADIERIMPGFMNQAA